MNAPEVAGSAIPPADPSIQEAVPSKGSSTGDFGYREDCARVGEEVARDVSAADCVSECQSSEFERVRICAGLVRYSRLTAYRAQYIPRDSLRRFRGWSWAGDVGVDAMVGSCRFGSYDAFRPTFLVFYESLRFPRYFTYFLSLESEEKESSGSGVLVYIGF